MINKKIKKDIGLTLVETLVAISILLISVIGPMVIYSRNISYARFIGNQNTAYYLAQEAVEFIKYKVYTNFNSGALWLTGLSDCISSSCKFVSIYTNIELCGTDGCPKMKIDSGSGLYNYTTGPDTTFVRNVIIETLDNGKEATVTATVSWNNMGISKTITVEENIFEWQ